MKTLKILASNSKRFRVYDIFKKWQTDGDRGRAKYISFLDNASLKYCLVLQIFLGMTQETQKTTSKLT